MHYVLFEKKILKNINLLHYQSNELSLSNIQLKYRENNRGRGRFFKVYFEDKIKSDPSEKPRPLQDNQYFFHVLIVLLMITLTF